MARTKINPEVDLVVAESTADGYVQTVTLADASGNAYGGTKAVYRPTITVATAAYVAGDGIGGIISLTNFVPVSGGKAEIDGITITELGGQTPALTITFFKATPTGGTYSDNDPLAVDATDVADETGSPVQFVAGDYRTINATGHKKASLTFPPITVECAATTLFMLIQADAAYDAVAGTDFVMRISYRKL